MVRGKVDECTNQKPGTQTHTAPDSDGSTNLKAERRNGDAVEDPMVRALSLETEVKAETVGGGERTANREGDSAICLVEEAVDVAEAEADMASNAAAECESAQLAAEACAAEATADIESSASTRPSSPRTSPGTAQKATLAAAAAVYAARAAAAANVAVRAAARAGEAAKAAAAAAGAESLVQGAQDISIERPIPFRTLSFSRKRTRWTLGSIDNVPVLLRMMWENQGVCAARVSAVFLFSSFCCTFCVCMRECE
jgi:hypothetical protein